MKFPGFWVLGGAGKVLVSSTTFDETDLDPDTRWTEHWMNQGTESSQKGFVHAQPALAYAIELLARTDLPAIEEVPEDAKVFDSIAAVTDYFAQH